MGAPRDPYNLVGQQVDRYRIQQKLGQGGMGVVYKALDTGLDRTVAIKMITAQYADHDHFVRRFWTEAKAMAQLESPYIIKVYDVEETDYGLWLIMEYVPGEELADRIAEGPMPWTEALPIMRQALHGFAYAHRRNVLHRDVKPSNVLLSEGGQVKILDFGLAKVQQASGESTVTAGTGGTLYYMAPEQVKGLAHVDARSDLYSWGMSCYEMLTGELPLDKTEGQFSVMQAIVHGAFHKPIAFPGDVPEPLQQTIRTAIALDPADRYQTAEAMLEALEGVGGGEVTATPLIGVPIAQPAPVAASVPAAGPVRTAPAADGAPSRTMWALLGLALLVAALGVGIWWWTRPPNPEVTGAMAAHDRTIATDPPGARVMAQGTWLGAAPVEVPAELVPDSSMRLVVYAEHPGYLPLRQEVAAGALPLRLALKPAGLVRIQLDDADAQVTLDGASVPPGQWDSLLVAAGSHVLRIEQTGRAPVEQTLEVEQGGVYPVSLVQASVPAVADASSTGDAVRDPDVQSATQQPPSSASTPERRPPPEGSPPDDRRPSRTTDQSPDPVVLEVIPRPYADIYIDGRLHQSGFDRLYRVELPPGDHRVRLVHPAGTFDQVITLSPGEPPRRLDVDLLNQ